MKRNWAKCLEGLVVVTSLFYLFNKLSHSYNAIYAKGLYNALVTSKVTSSNLSCFLSAERTPYPSARIEHLHNNSEPHGFP